MLAYSHCTLDDLQKKAEVKEWRTGTWIKARRVLVGESLPDFLPQETGKHSWLGCRIHQKVVLANRNQARAWTEAQYSQLPRDWIFEDFPDGRGGVEKQTLFALDYTESGESRHSSARLITFFEEHGAYLKEQMLARQLVAGQGADIYGLTVQGTRKAPTANIRVKTLEEARSQVAAQREANLSRAAGAAAAGGAIVAIDDNSQERAQVVHSDSDTEEPTETTDDPLTAQALALSGAAQCAAAVGAMRRIRKPTGKGSGKKGSSKGNKGAHAGGASPNRKALTKAEESLLAQFRSLVKEIEFSEILKGWRLGKARYRARELLKRLRTGNFIDEEEELKVVLEVSDYCDVLSIENVRTIAMGDFWSVAKKLNEHGVQVPDTAAVQHVKRVSRALVEEPTHESICSLVQVLKLKCAPGDRAEYDPQQPRLCVLLSIEWEAREKIHVSHIGDFILTLARRGETMTDQVQMLKDALDAEEEKCEDTIHAPHVSVLAIMVALITMNTNELGTVQAFFRDKKNALSATLRTREPYAKAYATMQEGVNYSECIAPKLAALLRDLEAEEMSVEVVRRALKDLVFFKNNAPAEDTDKILSALRKIMTEAVAAVEEAAVDEPGALTCFKCFKELFAGLYHGASASERVTLNEHRERMDKGYRAFTGSVKMINLERCLKKIAEEDVQMTDEDDAVQSTVPWDELSVCVEQAQEMKLSDETINNFLQEVLKAMSQDIERALTVLDTENKECQNQLSTLKRLLRMAPGAQGPHVPTPGVLTAWDHAAVLKRTIWEFDLDKSECTSKSLAQKAKAISATLQRGAPTSASMAEDYKQMKVNFRALWELGHAKCDSYIRVLIFNLEATLGRVLEVMRDPSHMAHWADGDMGRKGFEELFAFADGKDYLSDKRKEEHVKDFTRLVQAKAVLEVCYNDWGVKERQHADLDEAKSLIKKNKVVAAEMAIMALIKAKAGKKTLADQRKQFRDSGIEVDDLTVAIKERFIIATA